jgi:hypothetical protein
LGKYSEVDFLNPKFNLGRRAVASKTLQNKTFARSDAAREMAILGTVLPVRASEILSEPIDSGSLRETEVNRD